MLKNNQFDSVFINIVAGKFAIKTDKSDPEAIMRINKKGEEVYERHYSIIQGKIVRLEHEKTEFGDYLSVKIKSDKIYIFKIPAYSRLENGFLQRLPNVDLEKEVEIGLYTPENTTYLYMRQDGIISTAFSKEEIPKFKEITLRGKKGFDPEPAFTYLYEKALKPAQQKLNTEDLPF